jgi:hypothetical protein
MAVLEEIAPAVEDPLLLAVGHARCRRRSGVERRQASPAGADALDQRALRHKLELDLAGADLLGDRRGAVGSIA